MEAALLERLATYLDALPHTLASLRKPLKKERPLTGHRFELRATHQDRGFVRRHVLACLEQQLGLAGPRWPDDHRALPERHLSLVDDRPFHLALHQGRRHFVRRRHPGTLVS